MPSTPILVAVAAALLIAAVIIVAASNWRRIEPAILKRPWLPTSILTAFWLILAIQLAWSGKYWTAGLVLFGAALLLVPNRFFGRLVGRVRERVRQVAGSAKSR